MDPLSKRIKYFFFYEDGEEEFFVSSFIRTSVVLDKVPILNINHVHLVSISGSIPVPHTVR